MIQIDILDEERTNILPLLSVVNGYKFYLAGGTSLALQIGHRDSEDFDFFRGGSFNTEELSQKLEESFKGHVLLVTKEEEDTLYIEVDNNIKLSFFRYNYAMINPLIEFGYFPLASIMDIAKYPLIDSNVFLRGLTYTDDVETQKIDFKKGYQITMKEIDKLLQAEVKNYYK